VKEINEVKNQIVIKTSITKIMRNKLAVTGEAKILYK